MSIKPILFNTDMVRAILDGRKTVTRRVVKGKLQIEEGSGIARYFPYKGRMINGRRYDEIGYQGGVKNFIERESTYQPRDILYVRETYKRNMDGYSGIDFGGYIYKADCRSNFKDNYNPWHPSIHMPKEAARIFLKVTNVRVERLQEITWQEAAREGCYGGTSDEPDPLFHLPTLRGEFQKLWNSTIKKSDIDRYGWDANPWVWVIEFERCEKPGGES